MCGYDGTMTPRCLANLDVGLQFVHIGVCMKRLRCITATAEPVRQQHTRHTSIFGVLYWAGESSAHLPTRRTRFRDTSDKRCVFLFIQPSNERRKKAFPLETRIACSYVHTLPRKPVQNASRVFSVACVMPCDARTLHGVFWIFLQNDKENASTHN